MKRVNVTAMRNQHPKNWNDVWRIIKRDAPTFAQGLADPFYKECVARGASIELQLNDIPAAAHSLIPQDVILTD